MTERELEQALRSALNRAAPDDLDAILSRCGGQNGSVIEMKALKQDQNIIDVEVTEVKPRKKMGRWLAAACAALVLLGAGGGGLVYHQSFAVASVVSLDVNPSIELTVNRGERVISCTALNEDAAAVLFSMGGGADLKGTKLDVAVNAVVGALVQAGYMDSVSSAILISVEDKDQARAQRLQAELVSSVDSVLQAQAPGTSVLSQVLDADAPAPEYMTFDSGLSAGKSALVSKVMEMNGTIATNSTSAFDQLAALSVEELNDLLKTGEKRIPIGKPAAAMAVETYAGTAALDSVTTDVDPELDEGVYEVELTTAWGEFDYVVDAFTGEVLSGQKDLLNTSANTPAAPDPAPEGPAPGASAAALTKTQAYNAAAEHFSAQYPSLSGYNILDIDTKLDREDGRQVYDVDFVCGGYEFDYEIDASTGKVLKWDTDYREPAPSTQTPGTQQPAGTKPAAPSTADQDVGEEAAKQAALTHAGLSENDVTNWKIERDWDDGRLEYELEFWCGNTEYDYTIHGHTCAVLNHEVDQHQESNHHSDSHHSGTGGNTTPSSDIGAEAAKSAALAHAGVSESQTSLMKVKQDWDDGRLEYEVEFSVGRTKYEYTIDGVTGTILDYEQDVDD